MVGHGLERDREISGGAGPAIASIVGVLAALRLYQPDTTIPPRPDLALVLKFNAPAIQSRQPTGE